MGDADAAMGDLEHTLQLAPKPPAVGEALFFAALATGDLDKAADALDKVKRRAGRHRGRRQSRRPAEAGADSICRGAEATFTRSAAESIRISLPAKINLARVVGDAGRPAEAGAVADDVLAKTPDRRAGADDGWCRSYVQTDRMPEAIALLEKAHAAAPGQHAAHRQPGRAVHPRRQAAEGARPASAEEAGRCQHASRSAEPARRRPISRLAQKKEAQDTYDQILKQDANGARRTARSWSRC